RERISLVKNRMRGIRTSGSVGDGDGNIPIYPAMTPTSHVSDQSPPPRPPALFRQRVEPLRQRRKRCDGLSRLLGLLHRPSFGGGELCGESCLAFGRG